MVTDVTYKPDRQETSEMFGLEAEKEIVLYKNNGDQLNINLDDIIKSNNKNSFVIKAFGAIFGAGIGDSLGSFLEFSREPATKQ